MSFWFIVLSLVGIASIIGAVYMIWSTGRFEGVKKLAHGNRVLQIIIPTLIVAGLFGLCVVLMSFMNAAVVFIHFAIFRLLFGIAGLIVNKVTDRQIGFYWQGWGSLIISVLYLTVAFFLCHHVWLKTYDITTDKAVGDLKIAMFADSHICTTFNGDGFARNMEKIKAEKPDIVFIVGDFVDDSSRKDDLIKACEVLKTIEAPYGVWYVFGNHDRGYRSSVKRGFSATDMIIQLKKNGVKVMEDAVETVGGNIAVVGRLDASSGNRKTASELIDGIDDDKYIIVLDHQPADYEAESATKADLVLSGHTHGGQLFPITHVGEWLGMNDLRYGHEKRNGTDFIVTSGISDWELKFKTGTKSEFVIINVKGQ
ncbi:MAG: metallophosphoesterase [Lachnospiraceae bacterium]|nr:metallophosphoesterase [Lachnospiraceae bacterium]